MKIFPLKPLSNIDKFNNLMSAIGELSQCSKPKMTDMIEKAEAQINKKPNYDREINVLGRPYTIRELRSIYKDALKQLSRDRFEKR